MTSMTRRSFVGAALAAGVTAGAATVALAESQTPEFPFEDQPVGGNTFTQEQAEAFLDMPVGVQFTAMDLFAKGGRTLDECSEVCEYIAKKGFLMRHEDSNGITYNHVPFFQGIAEYHFDELAPSQWKMSLGVCGDDAFGPDCDNAKTGTPVFYAVPCSPDVVEGGEVLPYDDVRNIIQARPDATYAIAPCFCRYRAMMKDAVEKGTVDEVPTFEDFATGGLEGFFSPQCNLCVETCLQIGTEADYWIWKIVARKITAEQALSYMERSCEDGFILQSCFSKDTGTICSCHGDCCGICNDWRSIGDVDAVNGVKPFEQISHYNLDVDFDECIGCGACAERCPLKAITMEDGRPKVEGMCFRCGQCAYVCPKKARKLVERPAEQNAELPRDFLDDSNMKAAYRFEHGLALDERISALAASLAERCSLTPRETDVLGLLLRGRTRQEVAQELGLSEWTVKGYTTNVYRKTGMHSAKDLMVLIGDANA